jgi:exonuclease V gamma subunit
MSYRHIVEKEWPPVDTVQDQCRLMDAICARVVALRIVKLCKHLRLSEKEGWSLYGLQIIKQVMEQGILWGLNENHQATLDFLNNLRKTPEFFEYRFVLCFLSFWD